MITGHKLVAALGTMSQNVHLVYHKDHSRLCREFLFKGTFMLIINYNCIFFFSFFLFIYVQLFVNTAD